MDVLSANTPLESNLIGFQRLNALVPYYSMFPLDFPLRHLATAKPGQWVLDPFCGRGTTNYAARLLGLPTVAIDCNLVAVAITRAKMVDVTPASVINECSRILSSTRQPRMLPEGQFWALCYHPDTLHGVCVVRESLLEDCATPERIALTGIMLGILHGPVNKGIPSYLSNQMPRTYATKPDPAIRYWRDRDLRPPQVNLLDVVSRRANHSFASLPLAVENKVILGDSRDIGNHGISAHFDWVITSPPYPGMRSYHPDQWLRNWFLGGGDTVEYVSEAQIGRFQNESFVNALSVIWREVATLCRPGARLVVRFGALSSVKCRPLNILSRSLSQAQCGWNIVEAQSAGFAPQGRRQADQFNARIGRSIEEIDVTAVLE